MVAEPAKKHRYLVTAINYFTYLAIPCAALLLVIYTQFTRSTEQLVVSQHHTHQVMAARLQSLASIQASQRLYSQALSDNNAPLMEGALMEVELSLSTLRSVVVQQRVDSDNGGDSNGGDSDVGRLLMSVERYRELLDRAAERMVKGLPQEEGTNRVAKQLVDGLRSTLQLTAYADQREADTLYASLTEKIRAYHQAFIIVSWSLVVLLIVMWWRQRVQLRTEARLRKVADDAKDAVKARSEFMAIMSHEIRTPLNGVLGMADLLLHTSLASSQKAYVETIVTSGDSLLAVINDILDLSKIEAGRVELDNFPFALAACIKNNIQLVGFSKSEGVALTYDIEPGVPELICADKNRLSQILVNLLGNALKFTPSGYVKLQVFMDPESKNTSDSNDTSNSKGTSEPQSKLCFRVTDSGIGIRQEVLPHIFDAFTQADSTITRDFGGTGLGLAISKLLVTLMGGEITASSFAGQGSCFEFSINFGVVADAVDPVKEVEAAVELPLQNRDSVRILVAEDNLVNQKVVSKMLKNLHYQHDLAANGVEAVALSDKQHYDLILMDLQMPELSGLDAAKRILSTGIDSSGQTSNCPIIVALTANVLEEDRLQCERVGMEGFLTKPVKQKDLEMCLSRLLGVAADESDAPKGRRSTH